MRTVSDIIVSCGGPENIEARSGVKLVKSGTKAGQEVPVVSHWAVRKWESIGIPERHWPLVMKLTRTNVKELYAANEAARAVPEAIAS